MRKVKRFVFAVAVFAVLLSFCALRAAAQEYQPLDWRLLSLYFGEEGCAARVCPQKVGEQWAIFLPAAEASVQEVFVVLPPEVLEITLRTESGKELVLKDRETAALVSVLEYGKTECRLRVRTDEGMLLYDMSFYRSASLDALFFNSNDPAAHGRAWVEASETKENKASGSMAILTTEGNLVHKDAVEALKGRGNSTWLMDKKPYQIKLSKKDDLLDTGTDNKAKKWLLIANCADATLMRNSIALGLGDALGMEYNVEFKPVDLFYDGEYRGSYLLTEKVEIGTGRVDIYELEKENENVNGAVALDSLPVKTGTTENGASYQYCEGMETPADYRHGYLLEMEMPYRVQDEICWFVTSRGNHVVVKSPEFCSRQEMDYIASWYQEYEDACYSEDGICPDTGRRYTDYIDLTSTVQCYLINELSKNGDGFVSSAFIYLADADRPAKMGPLWDYDLSFAWEMPPESRTQKNLYQCDPTGFYTLHQLTANNWFRQEDFRQAVREEYKKLYGFIKETLLGDEAAQSGYLQSIDGMTAFLSQSRACNAVLWADGFDSSAAAEETQRIRDYIGQRAEALKELFAQDNIEVSVFADVPESKWYAKEIAEAARLGLVHGTTPVTFVPQKQATRRNIVQMMYNMVHPEFFEAKSPFTDVSDQDGGIYAIAWAASAGIAQGYPDGSFHPSASVSRAELVTLLYRAMGEPEVSNGNTESFTDDTEIPLYARNAMNWAVSEGILRGYGDGTLRPAGLTTRAELAAIILRVSKLR